MHVDTDRLHSCHSSSQCSHRLFANAILQSERWSTNQGRFHLDVMTSLLSAQGMEYKTMYHVPSRDDADACASDPGYVRTRTHAHAHAQWTDGVLNQRPCAHSGGWTGVHLYTPPFGTPMLFTVISSKYDGVIKIDNVRQHTKPTAIHAHPASTHRWAAAPSAGPSLPSRRKSAYEHR